jgi:hypothetical protein
MHKSNIIAFIEVYVVSFVLLYIRNSAQFTFVHFKLFKTRIAAGMCGSFCSHFYCLQ